MKSKSSDLRAAIAAESDYGDNPKHYVSTECFPKTYQRRGGKPHNAKFVTTYFIALSSE